MRVRTRLEWIAKASAGRPRVTLLVVAVLALVGAVLALGLQANTGSDTLVSGSSPSYRATADYHQHFGDDAVVILVRENLADLTGKADLGTLTELEACLAGQVVVADTKVRAFVPVPPGSRPAYGGSSSPCGHLMAAHYVQVVYGPGTFLNQAVAAVNAQISGLLAGVQSSVQKAEIAAAQLAVARHMSRAETLTMAKAAGTLAQNQAYSSLSQLALNTGISSLPSIDDPKFIPQVVFDPLRGVGQPKARFSYLFPNADSALVQVRLRSGLTSTQRAQAIGWIRQAVAMPRFSLQFGGRYTVSGAPVVLQDLASTITGSIAGLLVAATAVMALTLLLVFRRRLRLLPLLLALAATGITFGATQLAGASLTMASIAVLPVLIGLAVDYAVQYQSRIDEEQARTLEATGGEAVARAAAAGAPTIATAALATATGFLLLLLSPVPMVQGFGLLLVLGIGVAFLCALTAGSAAISLLRPSSPDGPSGPRDPGSLTSRGGGGLASGRGLAGVALPEPVMAAVRGAGEILRDAARTTGRTVRPARPAKPAKPARAARAARAEQVAGSAMQRSAGAARRLVAVVTHHPERVLALAALLAVLGWVADTQTAVQSDLNKLVPSGTPALRNLRTLEQVTGVSGEIDVAVRSGDVTRPDVIRWMLSYEQGLLAHYGYLETKGCAQSTLCPALSLPDLFSGAPGGGSTGSAAGLTQGAINSLLAAVPPYFSQAVITPDHTRATLAFGIRLMALSRQQTVLRYMRSQLHPPDGVKAALVGLPVLAAQADEALSSSARRLLTLIAGLLAVGIVLRLLLGRTRRAVIPLIPIALATGWSSLILFATGIPLNPMSATLGALVIAISTEFSVLLSERFHQERAAGHEPGEALTRTLASTGAAVLASGVTAIAGFGVLILSSITMLRDFGLVTVVDLSVSLAGVLLVLPAVLTLAERGAPAPVRSLSLPVGRPRLRRRTRVA